MVQSSTIRALLLALASGKLVQESTAEQCGCYTDVLESLFQSDCGKQAINDFCQNHGGATTVPPGPKPTSKPTTKPTSKPTTTTSAAKTTTTTKGGATTTKSGNSSGEPFIGTYYPNWLVYNKHYMGLEKIGTTNEAVDPTSASSQYVVFPSTLAALVPKLNSIYYAFLDLNEKCFVVDTDADASWYGKTDTSNPSWIHVPSGACKGAMNDLLSLKVQYPHLKLMLSVGGWTYSENYSACAAKGEDGFKAMYDSFSFYTNGDFGKSDSLWAGVDFDWEHPGALGNNQPFDADNDWKNYAQLVNYFRDRATKESRDQFMMTAAVGVGDTLDLALTDTDTLKSYCGALTHINMMTYDFWGKWDPTTGHNAPFCQVDNTDDARPAPKDLPWAVKDRIEALANVCGPSAVALGIPNYSPAWTDIPSDNNGLYQTSTNSQNWATWSTFSDSDSALVPQGTIHYWDLKAALGKESSLKVYSKDCPAAEGVTVPVKWVYSADKKIFAPYEDVDTVKAKTQWAAAKGLAGWFYWDMTQDKGGELVDAGRAGWGFTKTYEASGSKTCQDDKRPDFSKNPDGSDNSYAGCHYSKRKTTADIAGQGCGAYKERATTDCAGKKAISVGAQRSTGGGCVQSCDNDWGNGSDGIWPGDVLYYVCDGEDPVDPDDGGNGGGDNGGGDNGGGSSGGDCYSHASWSSGSACSKCASPVQSQCPATGYTSCYATAEECAAGAP